MSSVLTLPDPLSLSPAYRPSEDEVTTYAQLIAAREGSPPEFAETYRAEAELQLWVWHTETRQPTRKRRREGFLVSR